MSSKVNAVVVEDSPTGSDSSESDDSSSEVSSDSSDQQITLEYLDSLFEKARQSLAAKFNAQTTAPGGQEFIELDVEPEQK